MYINPIEILGLSNASDTNSIDNEIVKKEKRKLFADIDLSDNGVFEYYGLQLTKGNCENAVDKLTNNDFKEFYLYLANNKPLNEFLASGKESIFKNFKQDSIFQKFNGRKHGTSKATRHTRRTDSPIWKEQRTEQGTKQGA